MRARRASCERSLASNVEGSATELRRAASVVAQRPVSKRRLLPRGQPCQHAMLPVQLCGALVN